MSPPARFLHQGLTSSDILDTAFNVQLKQSSVIIEKELLNFAGNVKRLQ